jgi:hypothetical protein
LNEAKSQELVSGTIRKKNLTGSKYSNARLVKYLHRTKNFTFHIKEYFVNIRLSDLPIVGKLKGSDSAKIDIALDSDIKVNCSCPDFLFGGFRYIGTQLSYSTHRENRPPAVRNPNQAGTVCKHIGHILNNLPEFKPQMLDFMKRSRDGEYKVITENTIRGLIPNHSAEDIVRILEFTNLKRLRAGYREDLPTKIDQLKFGDLLVIDSVDSLTKVKYERFLVVKNPSNKNYAICFDSDKRKYVVVMNQDIKNYLVGHMPKHDTDTATTLRTNDVGVIKAIEKEPRLYRGWN